MFQWLHRHKFVTFALTMLLAGLAGLGSIWVRGHSLEEWIGLQIKEVANYYLEPHLEFRRLKYVAPRTVLVEDLTLTAHDEKNGNAPVQIIVARHARIELAEIPRLKRRIKIAHIELQSPEVRMISTGEHGKFVGFSHMLTRKTPPSSAPPQAGGPPPPKPSDIFQIRSMVIRDGVLVFDPRKPDAQPMSLDHINGELRITPAEAGGYKVALQATRSPVFTAMLEGSLDMDTSTLELSPFVVKVALTQESSHVLPPELGAFLEQYGVTGALELRTTGTLPLKDKAAMHLKSSVTIERGSFNIKHYRIPVERFGGLFETTAQGLLVVRTDATVLGGTLTISGAVPFDHAQRLDFEVRARDLRLEQVIDTFDPRSTSPFRGDLSGEFSFNWPRDKWRTELAGSGRLGLRNAYIARLPVLGPIVAAITQFPASSGPNPRGWNDWADADFVLRGDRLQLRRLMASTPDMAFRGDGVVNLKGEMNIRLNAGPLERIEQVLGPLGQGLATITDAVANYHVTGKLSAPHVEFELGPR